jgi:hypothetical protein
MARVTCSLAAHGLNVVDGCPGHRRRALEDMRYAGRVEGFWLGHGALGERAGSAEGG